MSQATEKFWNWFKINSENLADINGPMANETQKEELLNALLEALHQYCDKLFFQIGGLHNEQQELIITAEGETDYFEQVEELINDAPEIEGWSFIAFMPPRTLGYSLVYEDIELKPLDIWFLPLDNKNKSKSLGFRICLPNFETIKGSKWLETAVFKLLDMTLGEKVFTLDIDYIDIKPMPDGKPEDNGLIELHDMAAFVKWKKKKLASV